MSGEAKLARIELLLEVLEEKIKEIDGLHTELQAVCNHTPQELLTLFKEGYTLVPPTISPDSLVKRGRWETKPCNHKPSRLKNIDKWVIYLCSECGKSNGRKKNKFCPSCGALMED